MQTISQELKNTLGSDVISYFKTMLLYRRYWDEVSGKYNYETNPIDITDNLIESSSVKWKLDNEDFNVWNISNVSLVFSNKNNVWKQEVENGYFPEGKLIHSSKIGIKTGAVKTDGTKEDGYVFTGYITKDPVINVEYKTITIDLSGQFALLENISAEEISNQITDELVGTYVEGEPNDVFVTLNNAVGIIISVKKGYTSEGAENALELVPSQDYTVADINQKLLPAEITLKEALSADESLWVSYSYWYTDKPLEWIIE
ncbi:MAG TPA: hypothetical protein VMW66_03875, partial [Elusimicrobiales bacterium]|nr:hypothetical protein [Elusimicrobiales bacterium]